jgi:hypothetical protein
MAGHLDHKGLQRITLTISNVSGYRANVRFQSVDGGLQTGRVMINTNNVFRIGNSQMQLTGQTKRPPPVRRMTAILVP